MKVEEELKKQIQNEFQKRVVTLLFYGSQAFNLNVHKNSDYDFVVVLDKYQSEDTLKLNSIIKSKSLNKFNIEINLIYKKDIDSRGKENFQMRTSFATYYNYLENIPPLLGENMFAKNPLKISKEATQQCWYFKIQEYYGRCDKILVNQELNKCNLETVCKYTKEMVRYLLLSQSIIDVKDITKLSYESIFEITLKKKFLQESSLKSATNILKNNYTYKDIEYIRRAVYGKYLNLFKLTK